MPGQSAGPSGAGRSWRQTVGQAALPPRWGASPWPVCRWLTCSADSWAGAPTSPRGTEAGSKAGLPWHLGRKVLEGVMLELRQLRSSVADGTWACRHSFLQRVAELPGTVPWQHSFLLWTPDVHSLQLNGLSGALAQHPLHPLCESPLKNGGEPASDEPLQEWDPSPGLHAADTPRLYFHHLPHAQKS